MPLQHFQLFTVFQAHDVIGHHGFFHRHRGRGPFLGARHFAGVGQARMHLRNQLRQFGGRQCVVRNMGGDNFRSQLQ